MSDQVVDQNEPEQMLCWDGWGLKFGANEWELFAEGEKLCSWTGGLPVCPSTGFGLPELSEITVHPNGPEGVKITARCNGAELGELALYLSRKRDHLELRTEFTAVGDGCLHAWDVLPKKTHLNMYQALHMRNRHYSPRVVERYNLGGHLTGPELGDGGQNGGFRLSTDSRDWQFAPNPSFFVLGKHEYHLFLGIKDIPQGFGMELEVNQYQVNHWRYDCGMGTFRFKKGETISSPVFCVFVNRDRDYWDTIDQWVDILVEEKWIPDPAERRFEGAMLKPYLGPWIDQCYIGGLESGSESSGVVWNWGGGEDSNLIDRIRGVCNAEFIRNTVNRAEEHKLPFGTIGIDDRWFHWRGDYELASEKFPDMRGLVDELHAKGWKVLLWLPPFDVEPQSAMAHKREWLAGDGALTKHGQPFLDYSNPEVQEKFLLPKLRLWLGEEPGCWNVDGFKLDFMADKVPSNIPLFDRSWHGEEMFIWRWHQLVYKTMKAIKPDSIMLGCTTHPHFAQFQDWVRTYDVHDSDFRQHGTRGLRIRHLAPGTIVSYDFHLKSERLQGYLDLANSEGAQIEIGGVWGFDDAAVTDENLAVIREALEKNRTTYGNRISPANEKRLREWSFE